jgi:hypothetical protein
MAAHTSGEGVVRAGQQGVRDVFPTVYNNKRLSTKYIASKPCVAWLVGCMAQAVCALPTSCHK